MKKMTWREIKGWYSIHERHMAEDQFINDCLRKDKPIPEGKAFDKRVNKIIDEWHREVD